MYKFLRKSTLFVAYLAFLFSIVFCFFSNSNKIFKKRYTLKDQDFAVFIGDSHLRSSLNDELIVNHVNLAFQAESYYFSYFKLKLLFKESPQVKRVYLGYGYHNLSSFYDDFIIGKNSKAMSSSYFYILPLKEQIKHMYRNKNVFPTYMKKNFKNQFYILMGKDHFSYKEGYYNHYRDTATEQTINKRLRSTFYTSGVVNDFSSFNLKYFKKIIDLCKSNAVELVLINAPLHPFYRQNVPDVFIEKHRELIRKYGLEFIDLSTINMTNDCYFKDGDHLTQKGSAITTLKLNDYLGNNILN